MAATGVGAAAGPAVVVVEVIVDYPAVRWRGDVVAAASTVTAAAAVIAALVMVVAVMVVVVVVVVAGRDSCSEATLLPIGAP